MILECILAFSNFLIAAISSLTSALAKQTLISTKIVSTLFRDIRFIFTDWDIGRDYPIEMLISDKR